nr:fimbria/pilus periplasmic chaperone [Candidatus Burkholderia verschuerenii]
MKRWLTVLGLSCAMLITTVQASVTIGGTRVIYPMDQREVTVKLNNDSHDPSLVQVWIDDGNADAKPADSHAPFIITPPIFRIDATKSQTLRVMLSGANLPQDRESVFWLNVLDVPPKAKEKPDVNTLQLAYRTRIKVFVRPTKLPGRPDEAPRALDWKIVHAQNGNALAVSNPTAYYVSFSEINISANGRTYKNDHGGMVAPHGKEIIPIPQLSGVHGGKVHYIAINDFGGAIEGDADASE